MDSSQTPATLIASYDMLEGTFELFFVPERDTTLEGALGLFFVRERDTMEGALELFYFVPERDMLEGTLGLFFFPLGGKCSEERWGYFK